VVTNEPSNQNDFGAGVVCGFIAPTPRELHKPYRYQLTDAGRSQLSVT
jgi:hypothetical protein